MRERQPGIAPSKPRVLRYSAFEQDRRRRVITLVEAVHVLQAQMIEGPGIKAFRNPQTRILSFMQGNVRFHRRYDARNDIGPNFVHIVDSGQNTIAPNDAAILGVGQLDQDEDIRPGKLDRAAQAVPYAQGSADHLYVGISFAESESGSSRDDKQPP